jgi:uncharacterized repeat protein (TIGR04138 family)
MPKANFQEALARLLADDPRYTEGAYLFLREALDFTMKELTKPTSGEGRHVSGQELLDGVRKLALREYGPMACTVLARWGLREPIDVGNVVFNLIRHSILGKSDRDRLEDFAAGEPFAVSLARPFLPRQPASAPASRHDQGI